MQLGLEGKKVNSLKKNKGNKKFFKFQNRCRVLESK